MKNLVVIADKPGGKNVALLRAAALQRQSGAKIVLLGFCYADINTPSELKTLTVSRSQLEKRVLQQRKQQLAQLLQTPDLASANITIKVQWSKHIAEAIIAYCKKHPADLVIKSASRSERFLYTSTDWQLFRECTIPVMITASKSWKKKPRIVAALDFAAKTKAKAQLNDSIMRQAQALADTLDEEVHIAFVLTIPQVLADMDLINPQKYAREKRQKLQPAIDKFCSQYDIDSSRVHIKQGSPDKGVPSIASKLKADVVVTGVGRKGVKSKLLGNTAEGILSRLHTDIIAVKR